MLSREDNELITRVGPGTPMGEVFRRFWLPALLDSELPEPNCAPIRVRLLGEDLVAFRDSHGQVGFRRPPPIRLQSSVAPSGFIWAHPN
jgi:phthalate 4,5-dioxygenase oxygenase subunit